MYSCLTQLSTIKRYSIISLLFVGLLFSQSAYSQKLVQDSLVLRLNTSDFENLLFPFSIDTVLDFRSVFNPRLLGIDETEVYGLVPVDLHVLTSQPITDIIQEPFPKHPERLTTPLYIGLKNFEISNRPLLAVLKRYQINARVLMLHKSTGDSLIAQGELLFESGVTRFFLRSKLKSGYEQAFQKWLHALTGDLSTMAQYHQNTQHELPYNYRIYSPKAPWMQLRIGGDVILVPDGFLIDGQLNFVYPEHKRSLFYSPRLIRFRRQETFDAIEFGMLKTALQHRLTNKYCLEIRTNLLLGLNRWKDVETTSHKIYDALISDFSLSQSLFYFPKDTRSVIFGIGFHQNLYYIYSMGIQFQVGLLFKIGMQL
jgi:hypothetical protein